MPKNKAKSKPKSPDTTCRCGGRRPSSGSQFWVIDSGTDGMSEGTLTSHGPFDSQEQAEEWIKETSADDWIRSCGCLREGEREEWGDEYLVVQVVRSVRPVPPESVTMTLIDTANADGDGRREKSPNSPPTSSPFHPPTCSPLPESPKD